MDKAEALVTVLREHGVHVPASGNISCPWHDDTTPSMSIDRQKGLYNCHSCGRGGDVFTFLEQAHDMSYEEARDVLEGEGMLVIKSATDTNNAASEEKHVRPVSASRIEMMEDQLIEAEERLWETPDAVCYLMDERGLTEDTIKHFRLGVAGGRLNRYEGRLVIPYLSPARKPLSLRFRCLEDHDHIGHGKYEGMAGDSTRMFNSNAVVDNPASSNIAVCEGEIDAMTLHQLGIVAVAFPGVNNVKPHHLTILKSFDKVFLFGDDDKAGHDFNDKMMGWLFQALPMTVEGDVNTHFNKRGGLSIKMMIGERM